MNMKHRCWARWVCGKWNWYQPYFSQWYYPRESSFENIEKDNPISPLEDGIQDYFHIEKEKWKIIGPQLDFAPIDGTDKENEVVIGPPFLPHIIFHDTSIDTLGKKNCHFPFHEKENLDIINCPFWEDHIFGNNNDMIYKALSHTYLPYDFGSIFKSLKPLQLDFMKRILLILRLHLFRFLFFVILSLHQVIPSSLVIRSKVTMIPFSFQV